MIAELLQRHGATSKLVRAFCRANGWRYTAQGAPEEWYAAWRGGVASELEAALAARGRP